jgi:tetratricopeptide (TPR) repeat protein
VHLQLAEYPLARQRYEEARPIYHAIGARLGEANCIKSLGEVASGLEDWEAARAAYREASARYRAMGDLWSEANTLDSLATTYHKQKLGERAVAIFGEAIQVYPQEPLWLENRAAAYLKMADFAAAEADLNAAAELQSDHPYLALRRGDLARKQEQFAAAVQYYRTALSALPNSHEGHFGLGLALLCLGQEADGLAEIRRALELTYAPREFKEFSEELEETLAAQPDLPGLADAVALARARVPAAKPAAEAG